MLLSHPKSSPRTSNLNKVKSRKFSIVLSQFCLIAIYRNPVSGKSPFCKVTPFLNIYRYCTLHRALILTIFCVSLRGNTTNIDNFSQVNVYFQNGMKQIPIEILQFEFQCPSFSEIAKYENLCSS